MVYVREAHPSDSNWADPAQPIADPTTLAERGAVASQCCAELGLSLPTVVDDMQDTVNQRYRAWPERIYVIDRDGRIAYRGGIGPFGFAPKEAERALEQVLDGKR
jgi:type I thyroxine 5'-deiodinase